MKLSNREKIFGLKYLLLLLLIASPTWAQDFNKGVEAYWRDDYEEALQNFRPLAGQGHAGAQNSLGLMYDQGQGVPQNYGEAVKWFTKAAEQEVANAQFSLGFMYGQGKGVAQSFIQAHKWFNIAAAHGHKKAGEVRDATAREMTSDQVAEAQQLAREWMERH